MNWKQGDTSIEADEVTEGFLKSFEMHGVKYSKLIGKKQCIVIINKFENIYYIFLN